MPFFSILTSQSIFTNYSCIGWLPFVIFCQLKTFRAVQYLKYSNLRFKICILHAQYSYIVAIKNSLPFENETHKKWMRQIGDRIKIFTMQCAYNGYKPCKQSTSPQTCIIFTFCFKLPHRRRRRRCRNHHQWQQRPASTCLRKHRKYVRSESSELITANFWLECAALCTVHVTPSPVYSYTHTHAIVDCCNNVAMSSQRGRAYFRCWFRSIQREYNR